MDNILERMPNWLRYILAVPFGILMLYIVYYIAYFSNLYVASPDSLFIVIFNYLYVNGINVFVMIFSMNYMLPKYQFQFTLIISVIFCSIGFVGLGMSVMTYNITFSYILGLILTMTSFIICCYLSHKKYFIEKQKVQENKEEIKSTGSWQQYLDNNFKATGTRTSLEEIKYSNKNTQQGNNNNNM